MRYGVNIPPFTDAGTILALAADAEAARWDGVVPLGRPHLSPDALAAYVGPSAPGWDVAAPWAPGVPAQEYADAGASWLIDSTSPLGD